MDELKNIMDRLKQAYNALQGMTINLVRTMDTVQEAYFYLDRIVPQVEEIDVEPEEDEANG